MTISIRTLFGASALFVLGSVPQLVHAQAAGCVVVYTDFEVNTELVQVEAWAHVEDYFDTSYCAQEAFQYWGYWEHSYGVTIDIRSPTGNSITEIDGLADVPYGGGSASASASLLFLDDYGDYEIICQLWIWCTIGQLFVDFFGIDIVEIPAWLPIPKVVLIALTFDDGPHELTLPAGNTGNVLATLAAKSIEHAKPIFATFFVERERIDSGVGQSIISAMDNVGHEIAIHGVDPIHHWKHQDTVDLETKLDWMRTTIDTATGDMPEHVRPPGGWGGWSMGLEHTKAEVTAAYGTELTRYTASHSTGGVNSWFDGAYSPASFDGACDGCVSHDNFVGYAKSAIDSAVITLVQARILLMHDIRPGDAQNLPGIIDEIENYADSKGVRVLYVPVEWIARLGI